MKSYTLSLFFLLITSCHSQQKATSTSATQFPVSPLTANFIERLKHENPSQPSATFINDFNLLTLEGQYYVSGLAKVNTAFDEKKLEQWKVHVNTKAGNIATLQVPVINFKRFLQSNGIDYFEVSEKVNFKKQ